MGLGLFIAKTLLERSGAELTFANAADPFLTPEERPERCGAVVQAVWPAERADRAPGLTAARMSGSKRDVTATLSLP